jgi:hypothetical protein
MVRKYVFYLACIAILLGLAGVLSVAAAEISDVSPLEGTVGTEVTISGSGFGEKTGGVQLGGEKCKVLTWSDTRITCTVSKPLPSGEYPLTVLAQGDRKPSEPMTFSAFTMRKPEITLGELVRDGDTVTITGAFFGDKRGEVRLAYRDGDVVVDSPKIVDWGMDAIRVTLPDGLTGRFALMVKNEVGADHALFDLGSGPPVLTSIPDPVGYGDIESCKNARGIYYNGQMYVFSLWCSASQPFSKNTYLVQYRTFKNHQLSGAHTLWGGKSEAEPAPVIVQYPNNGPQKMFVFVTGRNGNIYFTRLNGDVWEDGDWLAIKDAATGQYITTKEKTYEVAPVYDPANHRLYLYYSKDFKDYLYVVYSDDYGNTWHNPGKVINSPIVTSAPSAVLYHDAANHMALLAVKDADKKIRVCRMYLNAVDSSEVVTTDEDVGGQGRPFLADLGPGSIALMFGEHAKASGSIYEQYYIPHIRKLDKTTGQWGVEYQPISLPDVIGLGREYRYNWAPNGAVMYEPNGSGGFDRVFYLFFGYELLLWADSSEPHWMFTPIENLGP